MAGKESADLALLRWEELHALQDHYGEFTDFLYDGITDLMGFTCTEIQLDIARYMHHGTNPYKMVQAQRSQAKTTIAAFYCVWKTIHNPSNRTLIFSAATKMSSQISGWIIQIINGWDILECMRPDRQAGDRSGIDAFDIHHSLRGPEKAPSVACLGIESSMQGFRADIVIPDDVESSKNSLTQVQRDKLLHFTRDFSSICQDGEILYLGTPQSGDSIYNSLPGRNYTVRIWPGRYPTNEELPGYGVHLAPLIRAKLEADPTLQTGGGPSLDRGKPTDPELLGEDALVAKEIDQGPSYFQLQHMLCTELSDAERYPLKIKDLVFLALDREQAPGKIIRSRNKENIVTAIPQNGVKENFYRGDIIGKEWFDYQHKIIYVDPAGGGKNGDETAYVILYYCNGYIFVMDIGALKGGYSEQGFDELNEVCLDWGVKQAAIEKNYGHGAFAAMWAQAGCTVEILDYQVSGQKEIRIAETLEPLFSRGRVIFNEDIIEKDVYLCKKYPANLRTVYQMFFQLQKITRDKDSLIHDDRLDALAGGCAQLMELMMVDETIAHAARARDVYKKMMTDPLGHGVNDKRLNVGLTAAPNMLNHIRR